jgi:hypothetical protein
MENHTEKKTKLFKGAGYLIGFLIGTVVAVIFVAITGIEALIGPIAASVSLPAGFALEKKFQGKELENKPKEKNSIIAFLVLGIVFLAGAIFFSIQTYN